MRDHLAECRERPRRHLTKRKKGHFVLPPRAETPPHIMYTRAGSQRKEVREEMTLLRYYKVLRKKKSKKMKKKLGMNGKRDKEEGDEFGGPYRQVEVE